LFGLFYLSEYVNLFTNAFIIVIIFFGAWWNVLNYLDNLINVIFYCFFTNNFLIEYTKIFNFSANTLYLNLVEVGRVQYWNNIHSGMMISFIRGMFGITYDGAYWSTSITFPIPLKTDSLDLDSINWNIFKEAELVGITLDITSVFNSIIPNQISDRDLLHYNTYIGGIEMWSYITDIDRSNLLIEVYDIEEVSTPDVQEPSQPRFIEYDLRYFLF
jgi:hypothetical protein